MRVCRAHVGSNSVGLFFKMANIVVDSNMRVCRAHTGSNVGVMFNQNGQASVVDSSIRVCWHQQQQECNQFQILLHHCASPNLTVTIHECSRNGNVVESFNTRIYDHTNNNCYMLTI